LFKTLVASLKTIVYMISNSQHQGVPPAVFSPSEVQIFLNLLRDGVSCFDMYHLPKIEGTSDIPQPLNSKEDKEILDAFASILTNLDTQTFQEIFNSNMQFLFERILQNQIILTVPQVIFFSSFFKNGRKLIYFKRRRIILIIIINN